MTESKYKGVKLPIKKTRIKYNHDESLKTIVVIIGVSASGKTTLATIAERNKWGQKVISATTRARRNGEAESVYVWMREKEDSETDLTYHLNLTKEYKLLETNVYAGNFYGTPRANIIAVLDKGVLPIIVAEVFGARQIVKKIDGQYNILVLAVALEQNTDAEQIIKNRDGNEGNLAERLEEDKRQLALIENTAHYVITNYHRDVDDVPGLELTEHAFHTLLEKYSLLMGSRS